MKLTLSIIFFTILSSAWALTSPSSLKLNIYQVAVSTNDDCSNPIVLFTSSVATEKDFVSNPTLGSGGLPDGTYRCIRITMDDVIKFTPTATQGSCTSGTEYSIDLCRNQASSSNEFVWSHTHLLENTTTTTNECAGTSQIVGSGGISNKVTMYLRTSVPTTSNADFVSAWLKGDIAANTVSGNSGPSSTTASGIHLTNAFVVSGSKSGVFFVDVTNKITGTGATCEMNPPTFGFRE